MLGFERIVLLMAFLSIFGGLVYAGDTHILSEVMIEPNPVEKSALITLSFARRVNASVYIETVEGRVVKTLHSGEFGNSTYEFFWDRISDSGEYVPEGEYYLVINYGLRFTSTKKIIILR